ncbi:MAG: hypothetical protein AAFV25_02740 [Bacteroidota bacterium]
MRLFEGCRPTWQPPKHDGFRVGQWFGKIENVIGQAQVEPDFQ